MVQRVEFVLRAKEGEESLAALCRDYGISRPTGYFMVEPLSRSRECKRFAPATGYIPFFTLGLYLVRLNAD
jgi:hypothetical protein